MDVKTLRFFRLTHFFLSQFICKLSGVIISFFCTGSSDEVLDKCGSEVEVNAKSTPTSQRSNTTVHVCWHRSTSVCIDDLLRAAENQLSGYLLRKFKNNDGWQKLWVVFTNFCLFFYKTYQVLEFASKELLII